MIVSLATQEDEDEIIGDRWLKEQDSSFTSSSQRKRQEAVDDDILD
jgi:hypothetical protein